MKKTAITFLIVSASFFVNLIFAQNSSPNYIPKEWRIPQSSDFKNGSGWNNFKSNGNPMPYFATGDFNGDNIDDYAWTLIKSDNSTWGVFVFMNNGAGKFTQIYVGGKGSDVNNPGTLYTGPANNTVVTRMGKGENICLYDDNENLKSKIKTKYDCLTFGVYEVGANSIYYFDKSKNKFIAYWGCME
ncbi:MAG: hypothetical protein IPP81_19945 [Chitinophagaceae bacterium]|nr:hypothetical protein [Chitinophagaceae bacterium]